MKKNPKINVIFRSCDVVNAVNKSPRPYNLDKKTLIKVCFKSLYYSIQEYNHKIIVLGDNLSLEMKEFFLNFDIELVEGVFGNDNSIRESIKLGIQQKESEWVYFCEDDYLHEEDAFRKIVALINEKDNFFPASIKCKVLLRKRQLKLFSIPRFIKRPSISIFPCDYPDRYEQEHLEKNFIYATSDSHWRQVSDTTFTFLMQVKDVKKNRRVLFRSANKANDRYLSRKLYGKIFFFRKILCLSPIPSLASHMHTQTLSPKIDCESLVNKLKKEL